MRQRRNKNVRLITSLALVVLVIFFAGEWLHVGIGASLGAPISAFSASVAGATEDSTLIVRSKRALTTENRILKSKADESDALRIETELLRIENASLKEMLGRKSDGEKIILARVIGVPNRTPYDTLLLDGGSAEGVMVGDKVVYYSSVALGEVVEVYNHSSRVRLYTTPGVTTPAVLSSNSQSVDLIGRGGGNFEIELPRDFEISENETVILPGLHSYTISTLLRSISDPRDPFKRVVLKSPVTIGALDWVEIISQ